MKKIIDKIKRSTLFVVIYFYFKGYFTAKRAKYIFKKVDGCDYHPKYLKGSKILFHLVRTIPTNPLTYFEAILAHAFRIRGASPSLLICNDCLTSCDSGTFKTPQRNTCLICKMHRNIFIKALNLPFFKYTDHIKSKDKRNLTELVDHLKYEEYEKYIYKGVEVGKSAKTSVIRYFQKGYLDDNAATRKIFKEYLLNAIIVTEVADRVYKSNKPQLIVTVHGVYATWEPFYLYFINAGIDVIVYFLCASDLHAVRFMRNGRDYENIGEIYWKELKERKLTEQETNDIDNLISERFNFKRGLVSLFDNKNNKKDEERLIFSNNYERRFALFTSVPWDAALIAPDRIFNDAFDWIYKTIDYFVSHQNYQLLIKIHPGELVEPDTYSFTKIINNRFSALPNNIVILPPDTSLKPYELFNNIDAGLVYNGTLGLEMAIKGVAALVPGSSHYTEKEGIVYKIKDEQEYFDLIENIEIVKSFAKDHIEIARKYAYLYFIQSEVPMPFFRENKLAEIDWEKLKDLPAILKSDKVIDHICRSVHENKDIMRI